MKKKFGFTLGEVLITLMIVGVTASLTIPAVMNNTNQQEYKAGFKKAVSVIDQAVSMTYIEEDKDMSKYTGGSFGTVIQKRLKVTGSAGGGYYTADGMFFSAGGGGACDPDKDNTTGNICATVTVDVNGQRPPNQMTANTRAIRDQFQIAVYPDGAVPNGAVMSQIMYGK